MGQVGVSITKRTSFRDSTQEFSNTYHYDAGGANPSALEAGKIIDALVAIEKVIHSGQIEFRYARCWSSGGSVSENAMITQKALTGVGSATIVNYDKERAHLIQWPAGVDSRGHPVTLKKWFHCQAGMGGVGISADMLTNTSGFTSAQRTSVANAVSGLNPLMVDLIPYHLVAESGRTTTGGPVAHRYLEHHQFGDQWRG